MANRILEHSRTVMSAVRPLLLATGLVAAAAATLVGAWQITTRLLSGEMTRIRDLEVFVLLRTVAEVLRFDASRATPEFVNRAHDVADWSEALSYAGWGGALIIAVYCALSFAVLIIALPFKRLSLSAHVADWMWQRALPLGIFSMLATPLLFPFIDRLFPGKLLYQGGALAAVGLALWGTSLATLRGRNWFTALRIAGAVAISGLLSTVSALALGLVSSRSVESRARAPGPNVLLISVDTLRPDHLGCYGYARDTSPSIDRIATEGVRFESVVSSSSWTLPAHMSLLSGLPSEAHGVTNDGMKAGSGVQLLSEVFRNAGYLTSGFVAAPYLSARYGFLQGFDHYDDYSVATLVNRRSHEGVTSPKSLQIAEDWLRSWSEGGQEHPFFVFLHLWDVHYDFTPPPPYDSWFDPDYAGEITGVDFERGSQIHRTMDPRDLEHVVALYDGEIRYTDSHIGRLLDVLQELGVLDDTVVVLTSDHGEEFFEHGQKGHRKNLYDETLLIPLLIRFPPAVPAGRVVTQQVSIIDIAPAILSLAGLEKPSSFGLAKSDDNSGQDLVSLIDGQTPSHLGAVAYGDLHSELKVMRSSLAKLIWNSSKHDEDVLFFDLVEDPRELNNVASRQPERVHQLRARLSRWLANWDQNSSAAQPMEMDHELRERLKSLGYIEE